MTSFDTDDVRTLSVVFTDVVKSTALFSELGEAAASAVRRRHFTVLGTVVVAAGGREVKGLGDGVMAVFECATAAVEAAAEMQCLAADERARNGAAPIMIRVGLSAGDVTVDGGDCFGEAVTEASRLCAAADADEILVADVVRTLTRGRADVTFESIGHLSLKGLPGPVSVSRVHWQARRRQPLRAILADDAVLVREGVARLLEDNGIRVVAQVGDADALIEATRAHEADLVITDMRMPPTNTTEGLHAAKYLADQCPDVAVMVLSQHLDVRSARTLLENNHRGVGYLLKERVGDIEEFVERVRRVAGGETVVDPAIVTKLTVELAG